MRKSRILAAVLMGWVVLGVPAAPVFADVRLPAVIQQRMVLQRDMPLPIWGWADPGEDVTVKIGERQATSKADDNGRWMVKLEPMSAGGPFEMTVAGKNTITLANILVGEVWLASGQSNMEMSVAASAFPKKEIAAADYPNIRLFSVPKVPAGEPVRDIDAKWKVCSPDVVHNFSAVGYFFAREIHRRLDVPVGVIASAWGGTAIQPWTPPEGFALVGGFEDTLKKLADAGPVYRKAVGKVLGDYESWLPKARQALDENRDIPAPPAWPTHPLASNAEPTGLYNGMIHPLVPFAIRGAIWYQGEANCADGLRYALMMKALIEGWRKVWGQGDFPFYYVQIAPYGRYYAEKSLPYLWEAQTASLNIPNTGMIVTTDIGDLEDIHPKNKQEVGRRLALWALAKTYGHKDIVHSGPLYKFMEIEGDKIRIHFDHLGGGLASRDGKPLSWFEIAGADQKFVAAEATIDGDTVVVSSKDVAEPKAVRLGWSNVAEPNLMNKAGLPVSPFRTDRW